LRDYATERCIDIALYITETGATVRQAAKKFGVSKSTVHTAVTIWNALPGGKRTHDYYRPNDDKIKQIP